ncbi:MAG: glycerophosphodiester phosphodiesterase [Armatimonadota bacterium]
MRPQKVLLTAHSGAEGTKPNSLGYLRTAVAYHPDIIEVDLSLNANNRRVISHDHPPGADAVPFESVLDHMAQHSYILNIDVKQREAVVGLKCELKDMKLLDRSFLTGLSFADIEALSPHIAGMRYLVNIVPAETSLPDLGFSDTCVALCEQIVATGAFGLNINYRLLTPTLVDTAKQAGLKLYVWTVDHRADMLSMVGMGVDSITTNCLAVAANALNRS